MERTGSIKIQKERIIGSE